MLDLFELCLGAAPFSPALPGFHSLTIRAVDFAEPPLAEHHMRLRPATAAEVIAACREHTGDDLLYGTAAYWDLWTFEAGQWIDRPQHFEVSCCGENFDNGAFAENGHFQIDAGLEHFFTGHANLLGARSQGADPVAASHPAEAGFLRHMAEPAHLRQYHEKTCDNIARLLNAVMQVKAAVPIGRDSLCSEGEEDFEARLDDILAAR
ncbi:MAG: hypothetical protein ACRD5F_15055 [Candidatus Acidiferrales bacterium]